MVTKIIDQKNITESIRKTQETVLKALTEVAGIPEEDAINQLSRLEIVFKNNLSNQLISPDIIANDLDTEDLGTVLENSIPQEKASEIFHNCYQDTYLAYFNAISNSLPKEKAKLFNQMLDIP